MEDGVILLQGRTDLGGGPYIQFNSVSPLHTPKVERLWNYAAGIFHAESQYPPYSSMRNESTSSIAESRSSWFILGLATLTA